ncbi:MAG: Abi family protein [Paludibacteraceae bacterium]
MKYKDFEGIMSAERMSRYLAATQGDTRKAMTLYRNNLHVSQEMFTVVSCFEIALRNAIDAQMIAKFGNDWLRDAILPGGIFDSQKMMVSQQQISRAYYSLLHDGLYKHSKLLSSLTLGTWKYMFANVQYRATGQCLLKIFPNKPRSTPEFQYNNSYIFNELDKVNTLRNRIAHHEPICFTHTSQGIDTSYVINEYQKIQTLFAWMGVDSKALLYGLDHVLDVCNNMK